MCAEFAELHRQLTDVAGVNVSLFQHSLAHGTPDACFPNNWFSTHAADEAAGGVGARTLVLYPMKCPNRAAERRPEIIQVCPACWYVLNVGICRFVLIAGVGAGVGMHRWERHGWLFKGVRGSQQCALDDSARGQTKGQLLFCGKGRHMCAGWGHAQDPVKAGCSRDRLHAQHQYAAGPVGEILKWLCRAAVQRCCAAWLL